MPTEPHRPDGVRDEWQRLGCAWTLRRAPQFPISHDRERTAQNALGPGSPEYPVKRGRGNIALHPSVGGSPPDATQWIRATPRKSTPELGSRLRYFNAVTAQVPNGDM